MDDKGVAFSDICMGGCDYPQCQLLHSLSLVAQLVLGAFYVQMQEKSHFFSTFFEFHHNRCHF